MYLSTIVRGSNQLGCESTTISHHHDPTICTHTITILQYMKGSKCLTMTHIISTKITVILIILICINNCISGLLQWLAIISYSIHK